MSNITVVLGASDKTDRYSNKAVEKLIETGFETIPVNTAGKVIHGIQSVKSVTEISQGVHTLTMYVNPKVSEGLTGDILNLAPKRVIFNPGSENESLSKQLHDKGVEVINACTLVMLATGQY